MLSLRAVTVCCHRTLSRTRSPPRLSTIQSQLGVVRIWSSNVVAKKQSCEEVRPPTAVLTVHTTHTSMHAQRHSVPTRMLEWLVGPVGPDLWHRHRHSLSSAWIASTGALFGFEGSAELTGVVQNQGVRACLHVCIDIEATCMRHWFAERRIQACYAPPGASVHHSIMQHILVANISECG